MQVFISWSGDRSRAVAELLDEWIQCVLQAVRPWMSSKDIDRGSLWFSEISDQLKDTRIGIVCLTNDNKEKPWILFESGALAKGLTSARVCTFLIDLEPTDVGNPLAQFNHTMPSRDSVYELVRTLNSSLGEHALREKVLEQVFDTYWPQFEEKFKVALSNNPSGEHIPARSEESILSEVLRTIRSLDRRLRTMESSSNVLDIDMEGKNRCASTGQIRREVRLMLEKDTPADKVEHLLKGKAPSFITKRIIQEIISELEEEQINGASDG